MASRRSAANGSGRATTRIYDCLRYPTRLPPSLLCPFAHIAHYFFRLTGGRRDHRGSILNYLLGLSGYCGGSSRGRLHALAECLPGLCHAGLQVLTLSEEVSFIFLTPFDILLPGKITSAAPVGITP